MTDEEMTIEFNQLMSEFAGDPEAQHGEGDRKIGEFLSALGYENLAEAFTDAQVDWWYA